MAIDLLLLHLLEELEQVAKNNEELFDSEARERMGIAVMDGFVRGKGAVAVPNDLGILSDDANRSVYAILVQFIDNANASAEASGMTAFFDRLDALQNPKVVTSARNDYDEFFGHTPPEFYDKDGNVTRTY